MKTQNGSCTAGLVLAVLRPSPNTGAGAAAWLLKLVNLLLLSLCSPYSGDKLYEPIG